VTERTAPRPAPERDDPGGVTADLDTALAEVAALRALGDAEDRQHDEARVYDASIRWGALLAGRLHRLALLYDRGAMSDGQQARYTELEVELAELAPVLDRLGLPEPRAARRRR
jgi:hypothetical protein